MPSQPTLYLIILATFVGFITLAFVLLFPVYRFLRRQERMADDWTPAALARRHRRAGNGGRPPGERPGERPEEPPSP